MTATKQVETIAVEIERNQRWKSVDGRTLRVMGVVDRYVVYRFKGAGAQLVYRTDFLKRFKPA